jgi:hypothetical protein
VIGVLLFALLLYRVLDWECMKPVCSSGREESGKILVSIILEYNLTGVDWYREVAGSSGGVGTAALVDPIPVHERVG